MIDDGGGIAHKGHVLLDAVFWALISDARELMNDSQVPRYIFCVMHHVSCVMRCHVICHVYVHGVLTPC